MLSAVVDAIGVGMSSNSRCILHKQVVREPAVDRVDVGGFHKATPAPERIVPSQGPKVPRDQLQSGDLGGLENCCVMVEALASQPWLSFGPQGMNRHVES